MAQTTVTIPNNLVEEVVDAMLPIVRDRMGIPPNIVASQLNAAQKKAVMDKAIEMFIRSQVKALRTSKIPPVADENTITVG